MRAKPLAGDFECLRVAIQAQKPAASQALQNLFRVPPGPRSCINVDAFRPDIEKIESFTDEHGNMDEPGFNRSGFALRIVLVH